MGIDRGFNSVTIPPRFGDGFSLNFASKEPRFGHDRATIGPRSCHDRASIVVLGLRRSSSDQVEVIPRCKTHDRGSITPRSRFDQTAIVGFFRNYSLSSDGDPALWRVPRVATMGGDRDDRRPSDGDRTVSMYPRNASDREKSRPSTQFF